MDKLTFTERIILVACKFILCLCYAFIPRIYALISKQASYCNYFCVIIPVFMSFNTVLLLFYSLQLSVVLFVRTYTVIPLWGKPE